MAKKKQSWGRKVVITLSDNDIAALKQYADEQHVAPAVAIRKILRSQLADYTKLAPNTQPANQLDIFDSFQIDIFNNVSLVSDEDE